MRNVSYTIENRQHQDTIETKEDVILDITGFFFHMSIQVKAEVCSTEAFT